MSTDTTAVEAKIEIAATQSEEVVTQNTTEVDYEAELAKKDAQLLQTRKERDNYQRGMLKAKGKLPDEEDNSSNTEEDLDAKIDRKVQERLLSTKEAQIQADKDKLIADMAKKNKELTIALKNRGQVNQTSAAGSNQDRPESKTDSILSADQLNALKAKGWNDAKIAEFKKNLNRSSMQK